MQEINFSKQTAKIGVVADTHVPDRINNLHPELIPALRKKEVDLILHAGDICVPSVLEELEAVAPVEAIIGNRDLLFYRTSERVKKFSINGVKIGLLHGHGNFLHYWILKLFYLFEGYKFRRYYSVLKKYMEDVDIAIFGHTHFAECCWIDGQMIFNPGSAGLMYKGLLPSFGVISINGYNDISGEIIRLSGASIIKRTWEQEAIVKDS